MSVLRSLCQLFSSELLHDNSTAESEASASAGDDGVRSEGVRSEGADGEGRGVRDDESGTDEEEER